MDPTALYYALSTIAQCAAALAALIGFLGLWRLDRLREEIEEVGIRRQGAVGSTTSAFDNYDRRLKALQGQQERLTCTLSRFLRRTLLILTLAIIGFVFANILYAWVLTRWIVWLLIIFASISLYRHTTAVVREAASSLRTIVIFAFLVTLTTPALAGSLRCTTYEVKSLGRLQTVCDDGTRAVHRWNKTLARWESTITPPPGQTCTGRMNPRTQQVEVRCR